MAFRIPGIDLDGNPSTNSFMGLSRETSKKIANAIMIFGFCLALPPFVPDPTDLLNPIIAKWLSEKLSISVAAALPLSYMLGIAILIFGAWIYPYDTHALLNGYIRRVKEAIKRSMRDPKLFIFMLILGIFIYHWYATHL